MLTVCYGLVVVIILGLFGWSKIDCFLGKLVMSVGGKIYFWQMGAN